MKSPRQFGIVMVFGLTVVTATAQTAVSNSQQNGQAQAPATKIETLLLTKGSLIAKDFYSLGKISGNLGGGSIDVDALIVSRVGGQAVTLKGLRIEITEGGRVERSNTSFLDVEEVNDLLRAIDYFVSPESQTQPSGANREVTFSTRGEFSLTCFGDQSQRSCALESGRIGKTRIFIAAGQLAQMKAMVERARTVLQGQ